MKSLEDAKKLVLSAFESVPIPNRDELIMLPSSDDEEGEELLRSFLVGKHWSEIPVESLKDHWSSFCYLSAHGYRFYLPSLLIASLDDLLDPNGITSSTLFCLSPSECLLYFEGSDEHFDRQVSLFASEQIAAVGAFLGLFLQEKTTSQTFQAARAFRWGWDKVESEERAAFEALYQRMHNWTYPEPPRPEVQYIVERVIAAFNRTPYPGDENLCGSEQGDEPAESALEFRGIDWRKLHPKLLTDQSICLCFLSDAGFRYYLPAYLLLDLYSEEFTGGYSSDYLTHGFVKDRSYTEPDLQMDWPTYFTERFSSFTRLEREAIVLYLEHAVAQNSYRAARFKEALNRYWLPSLS